MSIREPHASLLDFLQPYDPAIADLFLETRVRILEIVPGAGEVLYDGRYTVSLSFSFTSRWQESFCYIGANRAHLTLGFSRGVDLPDPGHRLLGTGNSMRHVHIRTAADLDDAAVQALLVAAAERADPGDAAAEVTIRSYEGPKKRPG